MDLGHMIASLSQLWSFSHARCDVILQGRHIEIVNAYNPRKSGWERDAVYFGFFWITGWLALCSGMLVLSWRRQDPNSKVGRLVLPFFLVFGLGMLYVQLQGMAQYVDVCRRILSSHASVPAHNEVATSPAVLVIAILAFAGAWFTIMGAHYRAATNPYARILPLVMMVLGGAFFAFVGGGAVLELFGLK